MVIGAALVMTSSLAGRAGLQARASEQRGGAAADGRSSATAVAGSQQVGSRFHEPDPIDFNDHDGFVRIFDGSTLKDWDGNPAFWRVENGAIVGESTRERPAKHQEYISYHGGDLAMVRDFDLKLEIKVEAGGGGGIQYRSQVGLPWRPGSSQPADPTMNLKWMMTGPQADFWYPVGPKQFEYTGQFYSENTPAGIVAWRGEVVNATPDKAPRLIADIDSRAALGGYVRINDWNQYLIVARGGTFLHILNGRLMSALIDDDPASPHNRAGLIGFEIEGTPCKVSIRDVWLKKLR
ncbi:MAG TPA: DUF1080 domain-containing protein [Vicinamibacterales bacterium]|jgi:hypothetical protein|nr:DUF1080 domain-containing protein [Vicinamibacterales bacterium]